MNTVHLRTIGTLCAAILLTSCFGRDDDESPAPSSEGTVQAVDISGAKAGVYAIVDINRPERISAGQRPSAAVGVYATMYLAQGIFTPVRSAAMGILAQQKVIAAQSHVDKSERYTLLEDFGSTLKVDIHEKLDTSVDRPQALDAYLDELQDGIELSTAQLEVLEAEEDDLKDEKRDKNSVVKDLEKAIRDAEKEGNFNVIADLQEQAALAQTEAADIEVQEDQVADLIKSYEKLIEVGEERFEAISANRRLILSGQSVVETPGAESLDLIEGRRGRSNRGGIFGE